MSANEKTIFKKPLTSPFVKVEPVLVLVVSKVYFLYENKQCHLKNRGIDLCCSGIEAVFVKEIKMP